MAYPKALQPNELELGQPVCILMTYLGKERAKHPASLEHPNDFDNWAFEGYVDSIDDEILTVKVTAHTRVAHNLPTDTFQFYTNHKYHQVGLTTPDYRLFRDKEEAWEYEKDRDRHHAYHINNREYRNEISRKWVKEHREQYLKTGKNYREAFSEEINNQRLELKLQDPEKYKERQREYDRKRQLQRNKDPEYRKKNRDYQRKRREDPKYREKENEKALKFIREWYAKNKAEKESGT